MDNNDPQKHLLIVKTPKAEVVVTTALVTVTAILVIGACQQIAPQIRRFTERINRD